MVKHRMIAAALAALVVVPAPTPAQTVCRPNELGAEQCVGPAARPLPRPHYIRSDVQALDRVMERPEVGKQKTEFVRSGERNRLGTTIRNDAPGTSLCRSDALGNLRCR